MTQPARERRSTEGPTSSSPTRVRSGDYTIDMRPKPTRAIRNTINIFNSWLKTYPKTIAAQFGAAPTAFEGFKEELSELKRKQQ